MNDPTAEARLSVPHVEGPAPEAAPLGFFARLLALLRRLIGRLR